MTKPLRPRLLDLYCGAGGAAVGYDRAGFEVVGVDIEPQPHFPFEFIQADALLYAEGAIGYDAIHASPPCQAYSRAANNGSGSSSPKLIEPTRELLRASGLAYVIENVVMAPLDNPIMVCGASLGLGVSGMDLHRHRLFECNFPIMGIPCSRPNALSMGVYGNGTNEWHRKRLGRNLREWEKREAMGIDWMNRAELKEAIPPAYTEHVGEYLMRHLVADGRVYAA